MSAFVLGLALPVQAAEPGGLPGTWIEVVAEQPRIGYRPPRDPAMLVIAGNLMVTKVGDKALRQSLFAPVANRGPQAINLKTVVDEEFWLTKAIYKIEGDTLTICESGRDKSRPSNFERSNLLNDELVLQTTYKRRAN